MQYTAAIIHLFCTFMAIIAQPSFAFYSHISLDREEGERRVIRKGGWEGNVRRLVLAVYYYSK